MPVASGKMTHRLNIFAPAGTSAVAAVNIASGIPAAIEALPLQFQQNERLALGGVQAQTVYTITVRYRDDVLKTYTLIEECHTERSFQILQIIPSDRMDWLELTCVVAE